MWLHIWNNHVCLSRAWAFTVQIGPYESVEHAGTFWRKGRFVISFYVNKKVLEWFEALAQRRSEGMDHRSWSFLVSD
jgi:hypothetical protein